MVLEVAPDEAVPWMAPQDTDEQLLLAFRAAAKFAHNGGTHAAIADGSVRLPGPDVSHSDRRALMTIAADDTSREDW